MTAAEHSALAVARETIARLAARARDVQRLEQLRSIDALHRWPAPIRRRLRRLEIPPAGRAS
jgi:hypothetical protein